jgi:hypothetical protein
LQLTEQSCLTGTACSSSAIDVYQADASVASAATGPALAGDAATDPIGAIDPATQGSWNITAMVGDWLAGGNPDDGLVIQAPTAGTAGLVYYSPTASVTADRPQLVVSYIPPAAPAAPTSLTVTSGDGGALVNWSESAWNYVDETDTATASFTVNALTAAGAVAATETTDGNTAVLTGLTDGTIYTISITATNPIGTSHQRHDRSGEHAGNGFGERHGHGLRHGQRVFYLDR